MGRNLRYLGIYIVSGKTFRCCLDNAKKSFYRAFNAIFGKIGRSASEEVILSLVQSKCLPCLLYGVDGEHIRHDGDGEYPAKANKWS